MKKNLIVLSSIGAVLLPVMTFAQGLGNWNEGGGCAGVQAQGSGTFLYIICLIQGWINAIVPVLIALAVVYFVWGVVSYVIGDDEEAKKRGKDKIIYGIIGLVVIVAMWGLVNIVVNSFGFNNNQNGLVPPCVEGTPGCDQG